MDAVQVAHGEGEMLRTKVLFVLLVGGMQYKHLVFHNAIQNSLCVDENGVLKQHYK